MKTIPLQETLSSLHRLIGNTPMVEIRYTYRSSERSVFAKCEHYNLTGSIKDRMTLHILQHAYITEDIKPADTIVEVTSGNTGISFAAIGRRLGHAVRIIMPNWLSAERVGIIKSLGAEVIGISKEDGGFAGGLRMASQMASSNPDIFLPMQFDNECNADAHMRTGHEIVAQLSSRQLTCDAFVAGVGTGGTVMGVGRYLRLRHPHVSVYPVEPAESPTLSTGRKNGSHRIQGISDEFIPGIVKLGELDEVLQVHDGDAIIAAQMLASELGLAVGISSGANFIAAVQIQNRLGDDAVVVTVFPDSNKKYLSTALTQEESMREDYLCPFIRLVDFSAIARLDRAIL